MILPQAVCEHILCEDFSFFMTMHTVAFTLTTGTAGHEDFMRQIASKQKTIYGLYAETCRRGYDIHDVQGREQILISSKSFCNQFSENLFSSVQSRNANNHMPHVPKYVLLGHAWMWTFASSHFHPRQKREQKVTRTYIPGNLKMYIFMMLHQDLQIFPFPPSSTLVQSPGGCFSGNFRGNSTDQLKSLLLNGQADRLDLSLIHI